MSAELWRCDQSHWLIDWRPLGRAPRTLLIAIDTTDSVARTDTNHESASRVLQALAGELGRADSCVLWLLGQVKPAERITSCGTGWQQRLQRALQHVKEGSWGLDTLRAMYEETERAEVEGARAIRLLWVSDGKLFDLPPVNEQLRKNPRWPLTVLHPEPDVDRDQVSDGSQGWNRELEAEHLACSNFVPTRLFAGVELEQRLVVSSGSCFEVSERGWAPIDRAALLARNGVARVIGVESASPPVVAELVRFDSRQRSDAAAHVDAPLPDHLARLCKRIARDQSFAWENLKRLLPEHRNLPLECPGCCKRSKEAPQKPLCRCGTSWVLDPPQSDSELRKQPRDWSFAIEHNTVKPATERKESFESVPGWYWVNGDRLYVRLWLTMA